MQSRTNDTILITGGSGFVGSAIRSALPDRRLRILTRSGSATPGPEIAVGDVTDKTSIQEAMIGVNTVIHLVAIIEESGDRTFDSVIRQGTENVIDAARAVGARRFVHMSALGARDDDRFPYLKAKWDAEQAVEQSGMAWTILRPSVIFGPNDEFINTLANLVKRAPIVPVVGDGTAKFQPVLIDDVAGVFSRCIDDESSGGNSYELGGPDVMTYETIIDTIIETLDVRRRKIHVPIELMSVVVRLSKPLPSGLKPPVTSEQLKMLALDNCSDHSCTEQLLGRAPTPLAGHIDYVR